MKKLMILAVLMLFAASACAEIPFQISIFTNTDYLMQNEGSPTYKYGEKCSAGVYMTLERVADSCDIGDREYKFYGVIDSMCMGDNRLLEYNDSYITVAPWIKDPQYFLDTGHSQNHQNYLNWSVRPWVAAENRWPLNGYVSCSSNTRCLITVDDLDVYTKVCLDDSFFLDSDQTLKITVHLEENIGNAYYPKYFMQLPVIEDDGNYFMWWPHHYPDLITVPAFVDGLSHDYGFSQEHMSPTASPKTVYVNITGDIPGALPLEFGEVGIWDCESVNKNQYRLGSNPTVKQYTDMKNNCCNLAKSYATCVKHPLRNEPNGVDSDGNFQSIIRTACKTPQYVYYITYVQGDELVDKILVQDISWSQYEDILQYYIYWDSDDINEYGMCWNFYDSLSHQKITPDSYSISILGGSWLTAAPGSDSASYRIFFEKENYTKTKTYTGDFKLSPFLCESVMMSYSNISFGMDYVNTSIYVKTLGTQGSKPISGASIRMTCTMGDEIYINNELMGKSNSSGVLTLNNLILKDTTCTLTFSRTGCTSIDGTYFFWGDRNVEKTMNCASGTDLGENETVDGGTTVDKRDVEIEFRELGLSSSISNFPFSLSGCGSSNLYTTNVNGVSKIYNLNPSCDWIISTNDKEYPGSMYRKVSESLSREMPQIINLTPINMESYIAVNAVYEGERIGNAYVSVSSGGKTIANFYTGNDTENLGYGEFDCTLNKEYTLTSNYDGMTARLDNILCEGEGKTLFLDFTKGGESVSAAKGKEFRDFVYEDMWPIVQMILWIFTIVVFFKALDRMGRRD